MDAARFDALTRRFHAPASRRRTLGALLAGMLALLAATPLPAATRKDKRQRRRKRQRRNDRSCYSSKNCSPGPGKDNADCDFEGSVDLFAGDFAGANFRGANFTGAQLAQADLRGADLSNACLVGANMLNASIDGSTTTAGAIFCHTLMPDGSINDSGCDQGTSCCPTRCQGDACPATCEDRRDELCSVIGFPFPDCCAPAVCTPTIVSPFLTGCQIPCRSDEDCPNASPFFGCFFNPVKCPYIGKCCGFRTPDA